MALPNFYSTYDEYFDDALAFLKSYQFLYKYPNTNILVHDILKEIPDEWLNSNVLKENLTKLLPSSKLSSNKIFEFDQPVRRELMKCLSPKKLHEISNFSEIIGKLCAENDVSFVIDLGCGLGYLSQLLYEKFKMDVLGIEGDLNRVNKAIDRQNKHYKSSIGHVDYVQHFITDKSSSKILDYVQDRFPNSGCFYLIGLHACADLSIDAIRLFLEMEKCKGLAIMPCCYHRIKMDQDERFPNMPLSESLKSTWRKYGADDFIQRPFLRLACQRITWTEKDQDLQTRIFHLMSRAVLQYYASTANLKVVRKKRKQKSKKCDFPSFLDGAAEGYDLIGDAEKTVVSEAENVIRWKEARENMSMAWNNLSKRDFAVASVLIESQDSLQSLCENLILLDKMAFLNEHRSDVRLGFEYVKVTDESVSPRCFALLANKIL